MKIAYCFLVYDTIVRYDIWNNFFFDKKDDDYVVYIHPKNKYVNCPQLTFPHKVIQHPINTKGKSDISIVRASLFLLQEAVLTSDATHFVFLSQSCIPIYSFNTLKNIITSFQKSVISSFPQNKKERYYSLSPFFKSQLSYQDFTKQQSNMILIREDVELLISCDLTKHFEKMECPDEHYFINVLQFIFKKDIIKSQIDFCNSDMKKTQALEFKDVNPEFIDFIRSSGCLFMRKILEKTNVSSHIFLM